MAFCRFLVGRLARRVVPPAGLIVGLLVSPGLAADPAAARTAHRAPVGACAAHRRHARAVSGKVIVYGKPSGMDLGSGGRLTIYYACLEPAGRPVAVGESATDGEYPGNESTSELRIAGPFVADLFGQGFASFGACEKYDGSNCQQAITWQVEAADVRSGRRIAVVQPVGPTGAVAVSATGALAWIQAGATPSTATLAAMRLRPGAPRRLTGVPQTLDTGPIGPPLRFTGATLSWTNAGQIKRQTIS